MSTIEILINGLGWALLHSIWQITVIALGAKIALSLLRKSTPVFKYNVLLIGLLISIMAFLITLTVTLDSDISSKGAITWHAYSRASIEMDAQQTYISDLAETKQTPATFFNKFMKGIDGSLHYIVGLWGVGFIFFGLRFFGSYWYIYRLRTYYSNLGSQNWQDLLKQIQTKLSIRKSISLLESAAISIPMVIGHLKPVVILPLGLATQVPFNQIEAILVHELAHIRRNDYLINLVIALMEWLFFFHPLFWWMTRQLDLFREHSCDDITIAYCGRTEPLQKALLDLSDFNQKSTHIAAALYKNEYQLLNRIKRMKTKNQKNHGNRFNPAAILLMLTIFVVVLLGSSFTPQPGDMLSGLLIKGDQVPRYYSPSEENPVITYNNTPETTPPDTTKSHNKARDEKEFNDDGIINLQLDAEGNLLMVKKDGKELKGEEREKYNKLAIKLKELKENEKIQKEKDKELDRIKKHLEEVEQKMQEVQHEYSEVMKEYMGIKSETNWSSFEDTWSLYSDQFMDGQELEELLEQEHDLAGIAKHNFFHQELAEHEQWKDFQHDQLEDQHKMMQEQWEKMAELREMDNSLWEGQFMEQFEEIKEMEELAAIEELDQIDLETRIFEEIVRQELVKDGLLDSPKANLSLKLSKKRLVVNGEKQAVELQEKYLKLYKKYTSTDITGETQVIIED